MRWSIIRVIFARELRDQLRDRRTIVLVAVLPVLLYPIAGFGMLQLLGSMGKQPQRVGVIGAEHLPGPPTSLPHSPLAWGSLVSDRAGTSGMAGLLTGLATVHVYGSDPLLLAQGSPLRFRAHYLRSEEERGLRLEDLSSPDPLERQHVMDSAAQAAFLARLDRAPLQRQKVDVLLVIPPSFTEQLDQEQRPLLYLIARPEDPHSQATRGTVVLILARWKKELIQRRLVRQGLSPVLADPFGVAGDPRPGSSPGSSSNNFFELMLHVFPFILVLWSLAGALYPAVDLCAGEKERGTMETLLVSPATRTELVLGKFLTIWVFSAATALVNLGSMALTASGLGSQLSGDSFHPGILLWAVVLLMPLSAFFSAIALAVGAYARSTKEGQYYLMPLFLATMPLIFVTLLPGVELNPFYSMVPVTGVALLLQALTSVGTPDAKLWLYFIPVLLPMVLYSWLALRWAIGQFNREDVLFREAERLDLNLWVRHLFRAKEALPSVGQALCCFLLVLALRWLSFSVGTGWSLLVRTGISHLAFVITPPLIMAVMLTTRPLDGLGLHRLSLWAWPATVLLALVCMPPLAGLATFIIQQFPGLEALLYQYHPLTLELRALRDEPITSGMRMGYFLVLVVLPALSEELAFRGFILQGLRQHLSTGRAILLSGFLFAVYQMNVFQLVPHLLFGMILGILVVRTGSVLPGMLFHLVYNTLLLGPVIFPEALGWLASANLRSPPTLVNLVVLTTCAVVATGILLTMTRSGPQEKGGSG